MDDGQPTVTLEATQNIRKGDPIRFDYRVPPLSTIVSVTKECFVVEESCLCGSKKCRWKETMPPTSRERLSPEDFDVLKRARTNDD